MRDLVWVCDTAGRTLLRKLFVHALDNRQLEVRWSGMFDVGGVRWSPGVSERKSSGRTAKNVLIMEVTAK